jgi:hypothetical protein
MLEINLDRCACTTSMLEAYTIQTTKHVLIVHTCTTYVTHVICEIDQHLQTSHVGRQEMKVQIKNHVKGKLRFPHLPLLIHLNVQLPDYMFMLKHSMVVINSLEP